MLFRSEVIARRMARAVEESQGIEAYDYVVINDLLEQCVEEVHSIVEAARRAPGRQKAFIGKIREELKEIAKGVQE